MGVVREGGVVGGGLHCQAGTAAKKPGVFAVVWKGGKKQVGLLCFCSLLFWHIPGTSGERPGQKDWWQLAVGGEGCHLLPSFICSTALSALLRVVLESRLPLKQGQGRRGGEKETRGPGISRRLLLAGAPGAQGMCRGLSRESGPTSFQTRLFIIQQQLAFLSVLCHPGMGVQAGERQALDALEAAGPLHKDAGVVALGCSGALASNMGAVTALMGGWGERGKARLPF